MGFANDLGAVFVRRWIAGTKIGDAISASRRINVSGKRVMINYLGEHFYEIALVENALETYKELLTQMKSNKIKGCIAVKATQLGLCISSAECYKRYIDIIEHASRLGYFVWLDMEESDYVTRTISLYLKALKHRKNIGICLQAKLRRSFEDAKRIVASGGRIRLVKGAYDESSTVMYKDREEVFENYIKIAKYLFQRSNNFIIATHDDRIVETVERIRRDSGKNFSFAMLKGIRGNLANKIARDGNTIFVYVPFGEDWIAYCARRIREGTNIALMARSLFQQ